MIQSLQSNGHTRSQIMRYTLAQVRGFTRAIERIEARRAQSLATVTRVATNGNKDAWRRFVSELEAAANGR